jgi:hypothetical protein
MQGCYSRQLVLPLAGLVAEECASSALEAQPAVESSCRSGYVGCVSDGAREIARNRSAMRPFAHGRAQACPSPSRLRCYGRGSRGGYRGSRRAAGADDRLMSECLERPRCNRAASIRGPISATSRDDRAQRVRAGSRGHYRGHGRIQAFDHDRERNRHCRRIEVLSGRAADLRSHRRIDGAARHGGHRSLERTDRHRMEAADEPSSRGPCGSAECAAATKRHDPTSAVQPHQIGTGPGPSGATPATVLPGVPSCV